MPELCDEKCGVCAAGAPALTAEESAELLKNVPGWQVMEEDGIRRLRRSFKFKDFASALAFTDKVGALAESAGHHPTIITRWGGVTVTWYTHKIKGLHRNDFIMAARTDGCLA